MAMIKNSGPLLRPAEASAEIRPLLRQGGSDDGHGIDLLGITAAGQVVDGGVQAQQDGAIGLEAAQALSNLKKLGSRKICILRVYSMAIITAALAE